jgi:hypothetical protein
MKQKTEKSLDERRCIVAYLDSVQARLASLPLASLGDFVREPHKGVIYPTGTMLQSATGEELRPFREAGRTLLSSVLDRAFKGELLRKE